MEEIAVRIIDDGAGVSGELIVALIAIAVAGIIAILAATVPIKVAAAKTILDNKIRVYTEFVDFFYEHHVDAPDSKLSDDAKMKLSILVGRLSLYLPRKHADDVQELATDFKLSRTMSWGSKENAKDTVEMYRLLLRIATILQHDLSNETKYIKKSQF
jgi:hypothetical protein